MCSQVGKKKTSAQLHTQTCKLISICAPYILSSLCTHPLSHPLFTLSSLLRSPSSLAQQQLVVCSNRFRSFLSLHRQPQQSPHRSETLVRRWSPTCTCMLLWVAGSLKKRSALKCVYKCAWECLSEASFVRRSMCADRETVWGCMVGRCCRDRWSFWCTIVVLSAFPVLQFGYPVRTKKSILLGCPPRLAQMMGAKGTLVSEFISSSITKGGDLCFSTMWSVCLFERTFVFFPHSKKRGCYCLT